MRVNYKPNEWNAWTKKSKRTAFKSKTKAVGDGELKLGKEYGIKPLGQNVSYDLEYNSEKWEVKKLDSQDSFRIGVGVSSSYNSLIYKVIRILENIVFLESEISNSATKKIINCCVNKIETPDSKKRLSLLTGIRKNEVSGKNLDKANDIIETMKNLIYDDINSMELYSSFDGTKRKYDYLTSFKKLELEDELMKSEKVQKVGNLKLYDSLKITSALNDDLTFFKDETLKQKLDEIVRSSFKNVILILVHEEKGYKPITNLNLIYCNRITSGGPRCQLNKA